MTFLTELERHIKSGDYKRATTLLYNHSRAIAELVRAAEMVAKEFPERRDGMDGVILPVGVKELRTALAALNGGQHEN